LRSLRARGRDASAPTTYREICPPLKYRPDFPERFGSAQHSRAHCGPFFHWYNCEHRHGGIGLLTPHDVHYRLADQRVAARARVLAAAHAAHPERFRAGLPTPLPQQLPSGSTHQRRRRSTPRSLTKLEPLLSHSR